MSVPVISTSASTPTSTSDPSDPSGVSWTARLAKVLAVGAGAALTVFAVALPASAHVSANPETAEQGSFTKVSFRVPNEEAKADTTKVEIDLPLDHPIAAVSVRPVPGWTVAMVKSKLPKPIQSDGATITEAVSKITWSKGTIKPGEFQEFDVSMGPLPSDTDTLAFKAVQSYASGEAVHWDQPTPPGGEEPEHPAPTLHLTKKAPGSGEHGDAAAANDAGHEGAAAGQPVAQRAAGSSTGDSADGSARLLAALGLATGIIGIAVAAVALTRRRPSA
jgi:uncharacterized protein YcnI